LAGNITLDDVTKTNHDNYKQVTGTTVDDRRGIDTYNRNPATDPSNVISTAPVSAPSQTHDWEATDTIETLICAINTLTEIVKSQSKLAGAKGKLTDGSGNNFKAKVTERGQLVTAPLDYSTMFPCEITTDAGACEVLPPISGKQFVITNIILSTNADTVVNVYESNEPDGAIETSILQIDIALKAVVPVGPLNLILNPGKWLNITATKKKVFANISGYYIAIEA